MSKWTCYAMNEKCNAFNLWFISWRARVYKLGDAATEFQNQSYH